MPAKLVFNIERVGWSKLEGQRRHDNRLGGNLDHVDLAASANNLVLQGTGDPKADVQACLDRFKAAPRADNERPFIRFVIGPGEGFDYTKDSVLEQVKRTQKFLRDEYGPGFVYAQAHGDEKAFHIHAVCVPLYKSKTKHREVWKVSHKQHAATKGKDSYQRLRRRAASALGLEYGEPGNKPRTETQRLADEAASLTRRRAHDHARELVEAARITAKGVISKAKRLLAETELRVRSVTEDLDRAAKTAELVRMDARAASARKRKAEIAARMETIMAARKQLDRDGRSGWEPPIRL